MDAVDLAVARSFDRWQQRVCDVASEAYGMVPGDAGEDYDEIHAMLWDMHGRKVPAVEAAHKWAKEYGVSEKNQSPRMSN